MTLWKKDRYYFVVIAAVLIIFVFVYTLLLHFFLKHYEKIEDNQNDKNLQRVLSAFEHHVRDVETHALSFALRDGTHAFVLGRNGEYIQANFADGLGALQKSGLDFLYYFDVENNLVYKTVSDSSLDTRRLENLESGLKKIITSDDAKDSGFVEIGDHTLIVASSPIVKSAAEGSFAGYAVGGRVVDSALLEAVIQGLFTTLESVLVPKDRIGYTTINERGELWAKKPSFIQAKHEKEIESTVIINDIYGHEVMALRVSNPRHIDQAGLKSIHYFMVLMLLLILPLVFLQLRYYKLLKESLHKQKEQNEKIDAIKRKLVQAQHIAHIGNFEWDILNQKFWGSDEIYELYGFSPEKEAVKYKHFIRAISRSDREKYFRAVNAALYTGNTLNTEYKIILPDGSERYIAQKGNVVFGENQEPLKMIGTVQDITEQVEHEEEISKLAYYDPLTLLPNRRMMQTHFDHAIAGAKRGGGKFALLYMDMDSFKPINDTFGHVIGDRVLQAVTQRLLHVIRENDIIGRIGGDEFIALLGNIKGHNDTTMMVERMLSAFEQPLDVEGHEIFAGFSVGIVLYPDDGKTVETLVNKADKAMYGVKKSGRNGYRFFDEKSGNYTI